jgi:transcriptional regulator with XRE-family HTH domain
MADTGRFVRGMPAEAAAGLNELGGRLRLARRRRRITAKAMAQQVFVSCPTLRKMERGDPTISAGVYVTALFVLGLAGDIGAVAVPEADAVGLAAVARRSPRRRRVPAHDDDF